MATTYWMGEQNNDFRAYTNQDFLFLLALTGFRRSEAESVEWKNVDLQFGTIKIINTKNHEDLLLPMGDTLWHIMRERKNVPVITNMSLPIEMVFPIFQTAEQHVTK